MSVPDRPAHDYLNPTDECDLVMKGGITSGVVYPPAVLGLAPLYRFRSIGGTSAGAIAAAATAAAEYCREGGGFERLEKVSRELAEPGMVRNLFQPAPETRPLMDTLFALAESWRKGENGRTLRVTGALTRELARNTPGPFALGAAGGAGLSLLLTLLTGGTLLNPASLAVAAATGWLGGVASGTVRLGRALFNDLPQNSYFGLCPGHDPSGDPTVRALTDWLHTTLNDLAGLDPHGAPLTFANLRDKTVAGAKLGIELRLVTTNLSQNCPYVVPFAERGLLVRKRDMKALFPKEVVTYLEEHAGTSERVSLAALDDYAWLPPDDKLPVVFGARLSLSFPVLISAVPIYTVKRSAFARRQGNAPLVLQESDLQINWFSDGGICSNFPIHFFDAWLPTRPTFGINLVSRAEPMFMGEDESRVSTQYQSASDLPVDGDEPDMAPEGVLGAAPDAMQPGGQQPWVRDVYLPRANAPLTRDWQEVNSLPAFVGAMFGSAQNYRDTQQSLLPSYRDRIVNVYFNPNEGGLNLAMDEKTIAGIQAKGVAAAATIKQEFNFRHHQWVRTVVLTGLIERQLFALRNGIVQIDLKELFAEQLAAAEPGRESFPYKRSPAWTQQASTRIHALVDLVEAETPQDLTEQRPPQPEAVLRVTPEF